MIYIRREQSDASPNARLVYVDPETEAKLLDAGFIKATGSPYYSYKGSPTGPIVLIYNDGTWEPENGVGFTPDEWTKLRKFSGVRLTDFAAWMKRNYEFIEEYAQRLDPAEYRVEEATAFVKVYSSQGSFPSGEYSWFIQRRGLLGSDGVIPAAKNAIPTNLWFVKGKYYQSTIDVVGGSYPQFRLGETPNFGEEMTDPILIRKIEDAFSRLSSDDHWR